MYLAIIIPTHNRKSDIINLISQLTPQLEENQIKSTILAVIDGSTDGTRDAIKSKFPFVTIVEGNGDWWYTRCINEGFFAILNYKPDYLLLLNDDIILSENYLSNIIEAVQKSHEQAIYGSVSISLENPGKATFTGVERINKWIDKTYDCKNYNAPLADSEIKLKKSIVLPGRGMLVPLKVMDELNGFDPFFFQYQSDYDFCLRALKRGYNSYIIDNAVLYGYEKKTSQSSTSMNPGWWKILNSIFLKQSRYYLPNRAVFYWRHYHKILWPAYMLKYLVTIFFKAIL